MNALSMEDFRDLHTQLVVPLAVADILNGYEPLDDEATYALHDALCDIDPDSALLAIALSAQHIAGKTIGKIPAAVALKFEAEKILQEYGPSWLAHMHGQEIDDDSLYGTLQQLPEDLEALADLMDTIRLSITDDNHPASRLCDILSIQARAHMEIADYILSELDKEAIAATQKLDPVIAQAGNNIIPFPAHRTRQ